MTMHINLSPEMEGFIKNLVKSGDYGNATEVIRDAIRRLKAEEMHKAAWRQAIEQGDANSQPAGDDTPYTKSTSRQIARDAQRAVGTTESIDPDVLP